MSESKHTPGPWSARENPARDGLCLKWIDGPNGVPVAEVRHLAPGVGEANAALIARAPDLLAEVERLREALTALQSASDAVVVCIQSGIDPGEDDWQRLHDADAKARSVLSQEAQVKP